MTGTALGQLRFRLINELKPGCGQPGYGFLMWKQEGNHWSQQILPSNHVYELLPDTVLKVGRNPEPRTDVICLKNLCVSWNHFQIYSIVYDEDSDTMPMVYARDLGSLSGTSVNGRVIGSKSRGPRPGFLLSNGDVIQVAPYWEFEIQLYGLPGGSLRSIQNQEAALFFDRYKITDRLIGHGTEGRAYLAIDVKRNRQLICKITNLDKYKKNGAHAARELLNRHLREIDILAKVRHPNLLTFEYAFRSEHTIYLFTELASGGDLFSKISASGCLDEQRTKFVMHQVVRGVRHLHKLRLAHRDLKPENIFFASGPELETRVILGDFGHAKSTTWGRLKSVVGTDAYQAPELHAALDTAGSYKPSVDIWALGAIVLYAMAPHTDIQSFKTMTQDNVDALLNLEFKELPISEAGQDFVRRCLKIDPNARMSISESRNHQWLKVEKHDHKEWTRIRDSLWRTSHAISPPVEPLPDVLGHIQQQSQSQVPGQAARFTSTRSKLKRHIEETELSVTPNDSPFFATSKTARTTSDSTFQQTTLAIDAGILDTGL